MPCEVSHAVVKLELITKPTAFAFFVSTGHASKNRRIFRMGNKNKNNIFPVQTYMLGLPHMRTTEAYDIKCV